MEWIGISYDARKAVLLSKFPSHKIVVVDFGSASVTKSCDAPEPAPGAAAFPFEEWLADVPGRGLMYVEELGTDGLRTAADAARAISVPREMLVDPSVPCGQSFPASSTQDAKFLVASGEAGVADMGSDNRMNVGIERGGALSVPFLGGERAYFDYRVPAELVGAAARPAASIVLNNREAFGVTVSDLSTGRAQLLMLRKGDMTWHNVPGFGPFFVRGFGSIAAFNETQPKTAQGPASAGASEWRKTETATGPSVEERFKQLRYVLPGKLDLYDVSTEKMYNIVTNQGDSEILLVDDSTVYYRVSDRLYSAAIGTDALGPAKLLAQSESIRDVHWAFIKR